jgi:hypothetical protein
MEFFIQTKVGPVEFLKIAVLMAPLFHEDLSVIREYASRDYLQTNGTER